MVVAIDGPAGSGKSTVAKRVAGAMRVEHVDTGAMYRAFALRCLQAGVDLHDESAAAKLIPDTEVEVEEGRVLLNGEDVTARLRRPEVTAASSVIAQYAGVRELMVSLQRRVVAAAESGAVVEGRDIGTVVLPDARVKIYLTATEAVRALRRARQAGLSEQEGLAEVAGRDAQDQARKHSPLKPAEDAIVVDTTDLDLEQVVTKVVDIVRERTA